MAEEQHTAKLEYKPAGPASMNMPTVEMPSDEELTINRREGILWAIQTPAGLIECCGWPWQIGCTGTIEALAAKGLLIPEWVPGIPGNNKMRQSVVFDRDGPRLLIGNRKSSKIPGKTITVIRPSKHHYEVSLPTTDAQGKRIDALINAARAKTERQIAHEQSPLPADDQSPSVELVHATLVAGANRALDAVRRHLDPFCGGKLSKDSEARVLRLLDELRRAFAEARMVPVVPEYQQDGNVVFWPGRGSVGPVSPAR